MDDAAQLARLELGEYLDERGIAQFADGILTPMNVRRLAFHMAWRDEPVQRLRLRLTVGTENARRNEDLIQRGLEDYHQAQTRLRAHQTIWVYDPRTRHMKRVAWAHGHNR
jgi:hypothetical protein